MYALIIVFIVLALVIGLFSVALVAREVVIEAKAKKQNQTASAPIKEEVKPASPAIEPVQKEEPALVEEIVIADGEDGNTVAFSKGSQTLDDKYLELSAEYKGYYDEIVRYAMSVEGSKRYKNAAYEEYKVGKNRLVRLKIRRGVITCELVISNLTFKNYISDNKVSVKQAPAIIKVVDEASLSAVKDSIGIAVKAIEEEKAYKKEQAKIRRRENRRAKKSA